MSLSRQREPEALAVVVDARDMCAGAARAAAACAAELGNLLALGSATGGRLRRPACVLRVARGASAGARGQRTRLETVCAASPELNLRAWQRGLQQGLRAEAAWLPHAQPQATQRGTGTQHAVPTVEAVVEHLPALSSTYERVVVLSCAFERPSDGALEALRAVDDEEGGMALDFVCVETSQADWDALGRPGTQAGLGGGGRRSTAQHAVDPAAARAQAAARLESAVLPLVHCTFAWLSQDAASVSRLARTLWRQLAARPMTLTDAVIDFPKPLQCGIAGGLGGGARSGSSFLHVRVCCELLGDVASGVKRCAVCACHGHPLGRAPRVCRVTGNALSPTQALGAVKLGGAGILRLPSDPAARRAVDVYEDPRAGAEDSGDDSEWNFNFYTPSAAAEDQDEPVSLQAIKLVKLETLNAGLLFGQPLVLRPAEELTASDEGTVSGEELFAALATALREGDAGLLLRAPFDAPRMDGRQLGAPVGGTWVASAAQSPTENASLLLRRVACAEELMPLEACSELVGGMVPPRAVVVQALNASLKDAFGAPVDYAPLRDAPTGRHAGLARLALGSQSDDQQPAEATR